jgi:hypothetical protein
VNFATCVSKFKFLIFKAQANLRHPFNSIQVQRRCFESDCHV